MEREMQVSQRVKTSTLEELNLAGEENEQKTMLIAKDMPPNNKTELVNLLRQNRDVCAWSFEDMKGLDPTFCQHQIHLNKEAKLVQQRRYHLNPNYAVRVKKEIDKLLRFRLIRPVKKLLGLVQ